MTAAPVDQDWTHLSLPSHTVLHKLFLSSQQKADMLRSHHCHQRTVTSFNEK